MKPLSYNGNEPYVFVSYSQKNSDIVYPLIKKLQEAGLRIWYDEGLPLTQKWDEVVKPKIASSLCRAVIFFVSPYFFTSSAIMEEVNFVFSANAHKDYFSIHLNDKDIMENMYEAMTLYPQAFLKKNYPLIEYFHIDNTYLKYSSPNLVEKLLQSIEPLNCLDERLKYKIVDRSEHSLDIVFIGKDSPFTNSLILGIEEYFSQKTNIHFSKCLISSTCPNIKESFYNCIDTEVNNADAFLIRPYEEVSDEIAVKIKQLIERGRKVLLIDRYLSLQQLAMFTSSKPLFVSSDFNKGGEILANEIKHYASLITDHNLSVLVLNGPKHIDASAKRLNALLSGLAGNEAICLHTINTNTFDSPQNLSLLESFASSMLEGNKMLNQEFAFIVLPNDNVAKDVIDVYLSNKDSALKTYLKTASILVFVGYDGIRNLNKQLYLNREGVNTLTIDTVPHQQGLAAASLIHKSFSVSHLSNIELTTPKLISMVNIEAKGKNHAYIFKVISNKKLFIFDIDGTIADTEALHWRSYNVYLKQYNINLNDDYIKRYIGNSERKIWQMINTDFALNLVVEEAITARNTILKQLFKDTNLQPFEYFKQIINANLPQTKIILSSQIPEIIEVFLKQWQVADLFSKEKIISVADGKISKEEVLKNINSYVADIPDLTYEDMVIFEDSPKTINIATALGIEAIGVEHNYNQNLLKGCKYIVNEISPQGLFIGLAGIDIIYYQDELPHENEKTKTNQYKIDIGGPAANAARTYAALGGRAKLITAIGNHLFGQQIKAQLESENVKVIDVLDKYEDAPNISSVIINNKNGNRTIFSAQIAPKNVDLKYIERLIPYSDFILYDCNLDFVFNKLIDSLKHKKIVIDAGSYKPHLEEILPHVDIMIASEKFIRQNENAIELADKFDFSFVAMSRGSEATLYLDNGHIKHLEPMPVKDIVDTLAAGDILHGAFCYYKFQEKLDNVSSLKKAMDIASCSLKYQGFPDIKKIKNNLH